ncbi:hypothetical protein HIM_03529 [Hirsutella minnesotensis 3608]|uniref:Uncharacterized protein n=1 Tax=Hirsutella minnesotensis 3608 TaxID=1043627 RepID=A0A0F7ZVU2_9HYPO|nr:hypothetical protein HIM_03529 [Hirsutella minnesotensis 3608]
MCGPQHSNKPRGGALAALAPCSGSDAAPAVRGDLTFHTPGCPGSMQATHARLTPEAACRLGSLRDLHVVIQCVRLVPYTSHGRNHEWYRMSADIQISSSGDLTRPAHDCGLFRRFEFPERATKQASEFVELSLDEPLCLGVGGGGIIGRRVVSLCSRRPCGRDVVVAEGIVGFNYSDPSPAML